MRISVYCWEQVVTYAIGLRYKSGAHRKGPVFRAQAPIKACLTSIVTIKVLWRYLGKDYGKGPRQVSYVRTLLYI